MMRESLSAGSRHAFALVSAGNGNAFQRRSSTNGGSSHTAGGGGTFVKLARAGNTFDAYTSADGSNWNWVGSQTISMSSTIYVGLAVTSHHAGALSTATFSGVAVTSSGSAGSGGTAASGALPGGWAAQDIGSVGASGSSQGSASDFTLNGSGADIWGSADEFQFAYRTLTGDGAIVTRVTGLDYRDAWTKAGVMMRDSLSAGSRHAFMLVSAGKGLAFQRRTSSGGSSSNTSLGSGRAPYFVKLSRTGSTFRGYVSSDGTSWTLAGSASISMSATVYVGLAVTSHADGVVANATFSNTAVTTGSDPSGTHQVGTPSSGSTLRLLHWNVHHLIGTDGVYDPNRIASWIGQMQPDIISLNEIDHAGQADVMTNAVKAATGRHWYATYSGWGNLILSRLPMHASSVCAFNPGAGRLAAHMSTTVNGRALNIWSAHLAVDSASARLSEVSKLQACAGAWAEARIVAGDYNMQQSSSEYHAMASGYVDAWAAARSAGTTINYSGNCDGCTRNSRIDYVFSSKGASFLTVKSAQMIDTRDHRGHMPSDHKPLIVTYTVR
jgi:endonuclease/exonuclease/phosphatase family metal-dependent hydrolase/regulation of enolase protein 1 (concanavalin A-like superfamily)